MSGKSSEGSGRRRAGALDPHVLEEIVRRVVDAARPERIVPFGSAARDHQARLAGRASGV